MAIGGPGRFMGGSPAGVILRLALASIIVGALMALLGITPEGLVRRVLDLGRDLFDNGWDALRKIGTWLLYGAVIVVPVWLLSRLFASRR